MTRALREDLLSQEAMFYLHDKLAFGLQSPVVR